MDLIKKYFLTWGIFRSPFIILILVGIFYVANTWSPSSYGMLLKQIDANGYGLIAGKPQPIRSDEWAVFTPQLQATVNNHYQRKNTTSYYQEDLRQFVSMPLKDWGLAFKPLQWGFSVFSPAFAYSLQWYACFALFIAGYALLFYRYRIANYGLSLFTSLLLYLSGFSQTWWTALAPSLAIFPWVLLAITELDIKTPVIKLIFLYWIFTCWFICLFYPPIIISLSFVGLVLILALKREVLNKRLLVLIGLAGIFSLITTYYYLQDYILAVWNTIYPGRRSVSGGSVTIRDLISMFVPGINIADSYDLTHTNVCEASSVGSYFFLFLLFFLDYKNMACNIATEMKQRKINTEIILFLGVIIIFSWMLLPIPKEVGVFLLFDRVPPMRMKFAAGIIGYITVLYLYKKYGIRATALKWLLMGLFVLITLGIYKIQYGYVEIDQILSEALFIIFCMMMCIIFPFLKNNTKNYVSIAMAGLIAFSIQVSLFGLFNPIQSTKPIFSPPHTTITQHLREIQNKVGYIEEVGYVGSTLNGLGFKSVSHVLGMPMVDYWKRKYPHIAPEKINFLFNRYARIVISNKISEPQFFYVDSILIPKQHGTS